MAKRILLLLGLYTLCRLLFFAFNFSYFNQESFSHILSIFLFGLRFDITAIVISNLLFITLSALPFSFVNNKPYQQLLKIIFIVVNSAALLFNIIDLELFKFQGKRATADVFRIMSFGGDFANTVPQMIRDFWYLVLIFGTLVFLLFWFYKKQSGIIFKEQAKSHAPLWVSVGLLLTAALCYIGFRGGLQYRPIDIMTASKYANGADASLLLNTPFTIIKTLGKNPIEPLQYFSKGDAEKISPVIHEPIKKTFRPLNVVIIVVESLGKEYIGSLNNYAGYTPFLDSLIKHSLVFTHAFANGKRSIEGIPCIVAGLPALMPEPFITSGYNGNKVTGLASILKGNGYSTMFFHGGTNGTMGFDNFCKASGFDAYYGRREYNNDKDFDGSWGIYDEPFLQYTAEKLKETKSPFFATVFTVSSHHPYSIPEKYKGMFKKGTLPNHESIQYADYSIKKFFETARQMPWYDSTLVIITADHTALSEHPFYQTNIGIYSIPIIYYMPHDSLIGRSEITTQQIDILPTVLDYLHYDEPYFAFGSSVFDTTADHFAVNYINDTYQIISGDYAFTMDGSKPHSLFNFVDDTLLKNNLLDSVPNRKHFLEKKLKAFIQNYNNAILNNSMAVK